MNRRSQLKKLVDSRAGGKQARFARIIKRHPSVVWQYLKGPRESMGEELARHIEAVCKLPRGWMDGCEDDETLVLDTRAAPSQLVRAEYERLALRAEAGEISWDEALTAMRAALAAVESLVAARSPGDSA